MHGHDSIPFCGLGGLTIDEILNALEAAEARVEKVEKERGVLAQRLADAATHFGVVHFSKEQFLDWATEQVNKEGA